MSPKRSEKSDEIDVLNGKRSRGLTASLLVGILAFAVYAQTIGFDFTDWDDPTNIIENPYLNPVTARGLAELWKRPFQSLYVPLVYTSFALDAVIWNMHPGGFHFTNTLLHALNVVLVHRLLRRLLGHEGGAVLGAVLFAVHPLQVEAVSWAFARKDNLSGFFSLVALLQYVRWAQQRRVSSYLTVFAALLLALLCKPSAVAVPFMILALGWLWAGGSLRRVLLSTLPWFLIAGAWTLWTMHVQPPAEYSAEPTPVWQRPFVASDALVFYVRKLFVPVGLAAGYDRSPAYVLASSWVYAAPVVPIGVGLLLLRSAPVLRAAGALVVAGLIPVLGFIRFRYQDYSTVADRYFYLSMVGVALAAGALYLRWCKSTKPVGRPFVRWSIVGCILAALTGLTLIQQRTWRNGNALWMHNLKCVPHCALAHYNLANGIRKDDLERAVYHFGQAVHYQQKYHQARYNLATALFELSQRHTEQGRHRQAGETLTESIRHYDFLLERNPDKSPYYLMAGRAYRLSGDDVKAEELYRKALRYPPPLPDAHVELAVLAARRGETAVAVEHCRAALRLDPGHVGATEVLDALRRAQRSLPIPDSP